MKKIISQILLIIILFTSFSWAQKDSTNFMSMEKFKDELKTNKQLIVLDVRTPQELEGPLGKIEGEINIPVQQLEKRVGELKDYKDKEIAVICTSGIRSLRGTEILLKNGFKAKNVLGGMMAFRKGAE
jgi:rhodanese-related sulfurtransferase